MEKTIWIAIIVLAMMAFAYSLGAYVRPDIADMSAQSISSSETISNSVNWSKWHFLSSIGALLVSATGIFFVWRNLRAAWTSIEETRRIGEAQTRAYVSFRSFRLNSDIEDDSREVLAEIELLNTGSSPASEMWFFVRTKISADDQFSQVFTQYEGLAILPMASQSTQKFFTSIPVEWADSCEPPVYFDDEDRPAILLNGWLLYKDVFKNIVCELFVTRIDISNLYTPENFCHVMSQALDPDVAKGELGMAWPYDTNDD